MDVEPGSDAINYWDGTTWSDITNATLGLDYTLDYHNTGFLAGHTLLTVGTPGDFDGDRDEFAKEIGVETRTYIDRLCRSASTPTLALMS